MGKLIDLTGQRFGNLIVTNRGKTKKRKNASTIVYWVCKCDCGNIVEVVGGDLKSGRTLSCGCYHRQQAKEYNTKHGHCHERLYEVWNSMKQRCVNPKKRCYKHYGGRGITICQEWQNDFKAFYDWALANGYTDDLTLDRINVNGNYEPSNCRWVTQKAQANNTRTNHYITYMGETKTLMQWSECLGISYGALSSRITRGWDIDRAMAAPVRRSVNGHYIA